MVKMAKSYYGKRSSKRESGFALAVVLLILLVMLVLTVAVLFNTATNATITGNYRISNETYSIANAGLERTINWFSNDYTPQAPTPGPYPYTVSQLGVKYGSGPVTLVGTPLMPGGTIPASNYPDAAIVTSFTRELGEHKVINNGKEYGRYAVNATLLSVTKNVLPFGNIETIERWKVEIKAAEPNVQPSSEIDAIIEVGTPSYFNYAIKTDEKLEMSQTCKVDAYDSRLGGYDPTKLSSEPASVGSNNEIKFSQSILVKGDADYLGSINPNPPTGFISGKANKIYSPINFDDVTFNPVGASLGDQIFSGVATPITLNPGNYNNLNVSSGAVVILLSTPLNNTYYFNELKVNQNSKVIIQPLSGPIKVFVKNNTELKQNADMSTTLTGPLAPPNLLLYTKELHMEQNSKLAAAVYAYINSPPDGKVEMKQNSDLFGAIATKECKMEQDCAVHYDINLRDQYKKGNKFRLITWSFRNFY